VFSVSWRLPLMALPVLLAARPGLAEEAPWGVQLFERARFDPAEEWFERVLSEPDVSDMEPAAVHAYLAALRLIASDEPEAVAHARAAVRADPEVSAPPGAPPRLDEILEAARSSRESRPFRVAYETTTCPVGGAPIQVQARLSGAPAGLETSLIMTCTLRADTVEAEPAQRVAQLQLPAGSSAGEELIRCRTTARSAAGRLLLVEAFETPVCEGIRPSAEPEQLPLAPEEAVEAAPPPEPEAAARHDRFWLWFGLGTAAFTVVTAAIVIGLVATATPDEPIIGSAVLELR
jgi:hypothetical protein